MIDLYPFGWESLGRQDYLSVSVGENMQSGGLVTGVACTPQLQDAFATIKIGSLSPYSKTETANKTFSVPVALFEGVVTVRHLI